MFVPVAVGELRRPRARLDAVRATTADLKEREQAVGAAALHRPRRVRRARRCSASPPAPRTVSGFANLIVTNIPGPQVPLYCLGAQMLEVYPIVPLSRNLTLNVACSRTAASCTSA